MEQDPNAPLSPQALRMFRCTMQLTRRGLGDKIGVSWHAIESWELGRRKCKGPAAALLRAIMRDAKDRGWKWE